MAKKRGNGEGSIYQRKDGLWVGQYKVHTFDGAKAKYIYCKSRKDAASKLAKAISDRDSGLVFDAGSLTVGKYLDRWLDAVEGTVRKRTWQRNEEIVRIHLKPALGSVKLSNLNALQLQSLYRSKLATGLSKRTVQIIHTTLHKALKQAVRWTLIPRNVAGSVSPPKPSAKEISPLSEQQVKALLHVAKGEKLEALYVLAVTTGLRQGELLGLKWEDIDLEEETLRVRRTVFNGIINPPKTAKSKRSVKLTKQAVEVLKNRQRQDQWVFSSKAGTPVNCHNLTNRSWKPLLRKAGLPDMRFHDLRHTCATLLLTKGVHPKIVQEMLGHSSISTTLDTYSHVLPNMQSKAVEAMDDIFSDPED